MTTTEPTKSSFEKFREEWMLAVLADTTLTAGQKLVLVRLVMHRNRKTGTAWPAASSLAADCAVSLSVARKALRIAEQRGYLVTVRAGHGGQPGSENRTSERGFSVPAVQDPAPNDSNRVPTDTPTVSLRTPNGVPTGYLTTEGTSEYEPLNSTPNAVRGHVSQTFQDEIKHPHPVPFDPQGLEDLAQTEDRCRKYIEAVTGTPPTDAEYREWLDRFADDLGSDEKPNWPKTFCAYVRDTYEMWNAPREQRPTKADRFMSSQSFEDFLAWDGTTPVQNRTPVSGAAPAPVIDAEIVEDHTGEETTITPLSFRALFTTNPRPSAARCLSALSTLQKAGITDEEIHRAHKAGRMGDHPDPDDCAERIIRDRDTITADCPF